MPHQPGPGDRPALTSDPVPGEPAHPGVDLWWVPLGAGARVVRTCGRAYEALTSTVRRRPRHDLYHAALVVVTSDGPHAIEVAPVPDDDGARKRGVVAEGSVGLRGLGRLRVFRYEVRRWRHGVIPDLPFAVGGPLRLTGDGGVASAVLDLVAEVPTPTWGRDELRTGDMWNSNSVVSWLLVHAGLGPPEGLLPPGGRAPGWEAGIVVARRGARSA